MADSVLGRFAAIGGVLNFPWILVGGIVVLLVALSLLPFLLRLDARTRNYFLASGLYMWAEPSASNWSRGSFGKPAGLHRQK